MSTYDHNKVLADYASGKITPEMAVGHSLQHISQLYEAQAEAKAGRLDQQGQLDRIDQRVTALQMAVDRLVAFMDKVLRAQKKRVPATEPKTDQS